MSQEEFQEIEKHCTPKSMLVVIESGELIRLTCPFCVIVIREVDCLVLHSKVTVNEVRIDRFLVLVYIINRKGYYYYNFSILL
jgi:hypothetical protein